VTALRQPKLEVTERGHALAERLRSAFDDLYRHCQAFPADREPLAIFARGALHAICAPVRAQSKPARVVMALLLRAAADALEVS
jgi:hypothetical protein